MLRLFLRATEHSCIFNNRKSCSSIDRNNNHTNYTFYLFIWFWLLLLLLFLMLKLPLFFLSFVVVFFLEEKKLSLSRFLY